MKKLALALLLTASAARADKVSAEERQAAYMAVLSIAKAGELDQENRRRLFYQLCSELKGCGRECARELSFCARPDTDPAQRATLVASCAADYRQRRDKGEALHPDVWMKERLVRFLDDVRGALSGEEQRSFDAARVQVKLVKR